MEIKFRNVTLPIYHRYESQKESYTTEEFKNVKPTYPLKISITKEVKPYKATYLNREVLAFYTRGDETLIQPETGKQLKWVDASMITPIDNTKCG